MPDPLKVECPHCNGSLKLKDRSADGRKVRCPKCQEIFKVQLPAEDDLEVVDDLLDDFGGEEDFPEEEPVPKAKSSGKKSKKKKKSAGAQIPWAIIGIAAAVLLSLGGMIVVVAKFVGNPGANKIDMTYLLPDANMVMHLKVQEMLTSPLLSSAMAQPEAQKMLETQGNSLGFNFKDTVSVTTGSKVDQADSGMNKLMNPMGQMPRPAAVPLNPHTITVVRTAVPIQSEKFTSDKTKFAAQTHNGKTYHKKLGEHAAGFGLGQVDAFYFPEATVLVLAMEADIKQIIDQGTKQVRRREFDVVNPGMTLLMALATDRPNDPNSVIKSPATQPQLQALEKAMNKSFRAGVAGIKMTDRLDFEIIVNCADSAGAGEMKTAVEAMFTDLKAQFEKTKTMLTLMDLNDVISLADKSLASIKVNQTGAQVVAVATIPSEIKAVGESLSKKLPGMGGMGLPGAGAVPTYNGPPGTSGGLPAGFDASQLPPGALPAGALPEQAPPASSTPAP